MRRCGRALRHAHCRLHRHHRSARIDWGGGSSLGTQVNEAVISVLSAEEGHDYRDNRADHH
jgi:hypothetical protein